MYVQFSFNYSIPGAQGFSPAVCLFPEFPDSRHKMRVKSAGIWH